MPSPRYIPRDQLRPPLAVGIDTLLVSYYLDGLGLDWEMLAFEKERLHHDKRATHAELKFGGETLALHRGAGRPYSYMLTNDAFTIRIGRHNHPTCTVRFASETLWRYGVGSLNSRFAEWYRKLGARMTRPEVVGRADVAFDFHVPEIDFGYSNFLSVADKDAQWRQARKTQSFQFGKSQIVFRFYDKVAEIEKESHKYFLYDFWGRNSDVWRAEWQVRGDKLKDSGIATIAQLGSHMPALINDLANRHTTLRVKTDDSNRSRWPLHPIWRACWKPRPRWASDHMRPKRRRANQTTICCSFRRGPPTACSKAWRPRFRKKTQRIP